MTLQQKVILGPVTHWALLDEAASFEGTKRLLIITGQSFSKSNGHEFLQNRTNVAVSLIEVSSNLPTVEAYDKIWHEIDLEEPPNVILAIGGGKILDLAKLVSLWLGDSLHMFAELKDAEKTYSKVPLLAVPTTAGSGAESTPFSVLYVEGIKQSIDVPQLLPERVVLDHRFVQSADVSIKLASGLDTVCQAIESLLSKRRTSESTKLALRSFELSYSAFPEMLQGDNAAACDMLMAANLAGQAIAITRTGVPHALSYLLSSKYGVPHGVAVATTMAPYLRWVHERDTSLARFLSLGRVTPAERWERLIAAIDTELNEKLRQYRQLYGLEMAKAVNVERLQNAAVPIGKAELIGLATSS